MENKEKLFVEGMNWKDKRDNTPEWIKGSIGINAKQLFTFLTQQKHHMNEKGWFTVDVKESKGGKTYMELNTWKPKVEERNSDGSQLPDF